MNCKKNYKICSECGGSGKIKVPFEKGALVKIIDWGSYISVYVRYGTVINLTMDGKINVQLYDPHDGTRRAELHFRPHQLSTDF